MLKLDVLIIPIVAIFCVTKCIAGPDKIVCYFDSWSHYRPSNGAFQINDIDATKCTHLIYGFVGLKSDGNLEILDGQYDVDGGAFKQFNNLKRKNSNFKTLIAVGGWNVGSKPFSDVAKSANSINTLASSALRLMEDYGFDGFDLDWEYPAQNGGQPEDKYNFYTLIKTLRNKFDSTGRKYLLTAAVSTSNWAVSQSYDIPNIARDLDFINYMTYDFHSPQDSKTGINAPLYAHSSESQEERQNNINANVLNWINKGVPSEKIIMGIPTYGKSFNLINQNQHGIGSPSRGAGPAGPYTNDAGILSYAEVCEMNKNGGWNNVWDNDQRVPYMYKGNTWVTYENTKSVNEKVGYAKSKHLGGIMIWSISMDDFRGLCGGKYPLLSEINRSLFDKLGNDKENPPQQHWPPQNENKEPNTSIPNGSGSNVCTHEGFFRDSRTCNKFYRCVSNGRGFTMYNFDCPAGLSFSDKLQTCDYSSKVNC